MAYAGVLTVSNRPNPPTIHMHMWCQLQKKKKMFLPTAGWRGRLTELLFFWQDK